MVCRQLLPLAVCLRVRGQLQSATHRRGSKFTGTRPGPKYVEKEPEPDPAPNGLLNSSAKIFTVLYDQRLVDANLAKAKEIWDHLDLSELPPCDGKHLPSRLPRLPILQNIQLLVGGHLVSLASRRASQCRKRCTPGPGDPMRTSSLRCSDARATIGLGVLSKQLQTTEKPHRTA